MSAITWLHLSDIHLKPSGSYDTNIVLTALLSDLRDRIQKDRLKPDFILVTGDIAYSGKAVEYDLARQFFDDLINVAGLAKDKLFVVPGNHDVDRDAISALAGHATSILSNRAAVNRFLSDKDERALVFRRFRAYQDFVNGYFGQHLHFDDEHFFYVRTIQVAGQRLAIIGLNSAWLAGSDQDRNCLRLSEKQVRDALNLAKDSDLRIAIMHHPFDWLQQNDRSDVESLLSGGCHFVLHGHMHEVGLLHAGSPDTETMIIAAGACYETRQFPNSYNFVQLGIDTFRGKISFRMYSDKQGGFWTKDTAIYKNVPDGEYGFQLPKIDLAVSKLVSKLEDDKVEPKTLDDIVHLGSKIVSSLVALIQADFRARNLTPSALHLCTPRQRRAFIALSRMSSQDAVGYLSTLTPPGMVLIPAGLFLMGSERFDNERPVSEVSVNSLYLARVPVTNDDYQKFIQAGGYHQESYWTAAGWAWVQDNRREYPWRWSDANWREQRDHPVQWLSWYEAIAYVRWLAADTNAPYRLPSEAEWEKAASWDDKAKKKREYPWGDGFDSRLCNLGGVWTTPVGRFSPGGDSPYGLADMVGQVWQWISSIRKPYPYKPDDGREDPEAAGERVFRGGSWANSEIGFARCASRYLMTREVWPYMNTNGQYEGPCGLRVALGFIGQPL